MKKIIKKILNLIFPIMFDDVKKEGRCPKCMKWSKSSYMNKKDRNEKGQSEDSYLCDSCYKKIIN